VNRLITFALIVLIFSCRNERVTDNITFQNETKTTLNSKNEVSSRQIELNQIKQPNKTVFRNLKIDTTKLFGLWSQDPTAIFADFNLTSTSFTIVGYKGKEKEPYILDRNKITVFYQDKPHIGVITLNKYDTLKIKWTSTGLETIYIKIKR
jgi:hypothetical protein